MEKSFDFGALLRNNEKKHKNKPIQLVSVKGGIQKRLETNIKNRKSTRLTAFDSIRNLPKCSSPVPVSDAQMKVEHRRQQLVKWKVEKEQKKKELAAQKKKPFVAGVARAPLKFEPPPPPPKPSTSGRVTRSQTRSQSFVKPRAKTSPVKARNQSFAPKNASFKPPEIKNLIKLPTFAPPSRSKSKKVSMITFEPVVPAPQTTKQTWSRPVLTRQNATESKVNLRKPLTEARSMRSKVTKKPSPKKLSKTVQSSSSSSDVETKVIKHIKTPSGKFVAEVKELQPKMILQSSTEESSENSSTEKPVKQNFKRKSMLFRRNTSPSESEELSSDLNPSSEEKAVHLNVTRKSLPKTFSPRPLISDSSSPNQSSDVEIVEQSPLVKLSRVSLSRTPLNRVPKSESGSEEKLRSPKSPIELSLTPEQMESAKMSPCVTMSRGKNNARKEMKWKIDEGLLDDDVSDGDSINHFRQQLSSEIKRMTEMCDSWDKISEQTVLPEFVQEAVLTAVGQSRLLMSQKMQQFASLIERAARPETGTALVTPADLHGFWDMVFMQVENVDMRFKKLEELRARGWVEEAPAETTKKAAKPAAKKAVKPSAGPSRLREMIAAARKAKTELPASSNSLAPSAPSEKTFEAGFFRVVSPVRSGLPSPRAAQTPTNKHTLLKAVLSSEAKKRNSKSTPFAMLRASLISKNVECDGVAPLPQTPHLTPVNLFATPGRSILKSAQHKPHNKSIKVVLFDHSDDKHSEHEEMDSFKQLSDSDDFETPLNSSLLDKDAQKENSPEISVVRTRSQKNAKEVEEATRRSSRKKKEEEVEEPMRRTSRKKEVAEDTPRRSSRKSIQVEKLAEAVDSTRKRSTRKKALQELEANVIEETVPTPKRSSRRSKALAC